MLFLHTMLDLIPRVIIQTESNQIYPHFTDELRPKKVKEIFHIQPSGKAEIRIQFSHTSKCKLFPLKEASEK